MEINNNPQGHFNQSGFMMMRLHEIFQRIDILTPIMFEFDWARKEYHYNDILNDLCSASLYLSAKLKGEELEQLKDLRKKTRETIRNNYPIKIIKSNTLDGVKSDTRKDLEGRDNISDALFLFRMELERLMDEHNIGNPSKQSPTKASIT